MNLSKSRYTEGLQCPKMLWMKANMPGESERTQADQARLDQGNDVGDLAMGYYGPFTEVPFGRKAAMIDQTKALMNANTNVICEATFAYEGNLCMADILRPDGDGWALVEVKSSVYHDPKEKKTKDGEHAVDLRHERYLDDMAFQYYVLSHAGVHVTSVSLMQVDSSYVRDGDIDIHKLFCVHDYTDEVLAKQSGVPETIARLQAVADQADEPDTPIGTQCTNPYACEFIGYCWRDVPERSVFNVFNKATAAQLYSEGTVTFEDIANSDIELNDAQKLLVLGEVEKREPQIDHAELKAFLGTITYPVYFLDFETIQDCIPRWDGVWPYRIVPFQYSVHVEDRPGNITDHRECLAPEGEDPRRVVAEQLVQDIPDNVCVIVWNDTFEKGRLQELAGDFPDLAPHLLAIRENIVDLMAPFRAKHYYDRSFHGSYSIKAVLPGVFPDDPALNYHNLDVVHQGGEASDTYHNLHLQPEGERAAIREALLKYCGLDTMATVKILDFLQELESKEGNQIGV